MVKTTIFGVKFSIHCKKILYLVIITIPGKNYSIYGENYYVYGKNYYVAVHGKNYTY